MHYFRTCKHMATNTTNPLSQNHRPMDTRSRAFPARLKRLIVRVLISVYILAAVGLAAWYWMRPVRAEQFTQAQEEWRGIAQVYHIPIPEDNRHGW